MRVEVYWNLHRKLWSVRHKGKVIAHVTSVQLENVLWVVQPAGREKVRREQRKTVHAFARGEFVCSSTYYPIQAYAIRSPHAWHSVTYNPYMDNSFVRLAYGGDKVERFPIDTSVSALLTIEKGRPVCNAQVGEEN